MNIFEKINFNSESPSVIPIIKSEKLQQFAIALGEGVVLKKHSTHVSATLLVVKGEVKFTLPTTDLSLKELDVFEIPIDIEHEVTGLSKENIFLITKQI